MIYARIYSLSRRRKLAEKGNLCFWISVHYAICVATILYSDFCLAFLLAKRWVPGYQRYLLLLLLLLFPLLRESSASIFSTILLWRHGVMVTGISTLIFFSLPLSLGGDWTAEQERQDPVDPDPQSMGQRSGMEGGLGWQESGVAVHFRWRTKAPRSHIWRRWWILVSAVPLVFYYVCVRSLLYCSWFLYFDFDRIGNMFCVVWG